MEQMIESQQRIERIQRSLAYLRDLHSRMVRFKLYKKTKNVNILACAIIFLPCAVLKWALRLTKYWFHLIQVDAGIGQESDDEEDEDEYSNDEEIEPNQDQTTNTRTTSIVRPVNSKRVQTISESSDVSMKDEDEGKT